MREKIKGVVKKNLKKSDWEEMTSYFEEKYDDLVAGGMSDVSAYDLVKNDVKKLNMRRNYFISSVFFPVLTVIYLALSMIFSYEFTWIIFLIGINIYLYMIKVNIKYIILGDILGMLLFLYFYSWIEILGYDNFIYSFVILYVVFMIIMLLIKQFKFVYIIWPTVVIIYLLISFWTELWSLTWIIFPIVAAYEEYIKGGYDS